MVGQVKMVNAPSTTFWLTDAKRKFGVAAQNGMNRNAVAAAETRELVVLKSQVAHSCRKIGQMECLEG